jgi:hypothetical protein
MPGIVGQIEEPLQRHKSDVFVEPAAPAATGLLFGFADIRRAAASD